MITTKSVPFELNPNLKSSARTPEHVTAAKRTAHLSQSPQSAPIDAAAALCERPSSNTRRKIVDPNPSMFFRTSLAVVLGAAAASAIAVDHTRAPRTVMEADVTVFAVPRWARGTRVTGDEPVALQFFLKHCPYQMAKFHADLTDRSEPASPNYAQWLDVDGPPVDAKSDAEGFCHESRERGGSADAGHRGPVRVGSLGAKKV